MTPFAFLPETQLSSSGKMGMITLQCSSAPKVSSRTSCTSILPISNPVFFFLNYWQSMMTKWRRRRRRVEWDWSGCLCTGLWMLWRHCDAFSFSFVFGCGSQHRAAAVFQSSTLLPVFWSSHVAHWPLTHHNLSFAVFGTILCARCCEVFFFFILLMLCFPFSLILHSTLFHHYSWACWAMLCNVNRQLAPAACMLPADGRATSIFLSSTTQQ